jgi:hypothetical protein
VANTVNNWPAILDVIGWEKMNEFKVAYIMGTVSWLAVKPTEVAVIVCDEAAPTVLSCTPKTTLPFDAAWLEDGVNI